MNDDGEVVRRVLAGDRESFRILVDRYQGRLCCLIRNLTTDAHDWEDIAQDAFLAAYVHLRSFDPERASFSTWLFTIARNKSVNAWKKRRPVTGESGPEHADLRTPEAEAVGAELYRQLDAGLASLPIEQKAAFVLAEIQELPLDEIARIEGVKLGTIKSRLSRAKEKLRAFFRHPAEQR
jgi:RNA polymerase sigma-70 factor (ECF subfamily)